MCSSAHAWPRFCTMAHLCIWTHTCAVLVIFTSCARQSPWPLTTNTGCWLAGRGPGGLKELGPLSVITLIKPKLCNEWLATGFIYPEFISWEQKVVQGPEWGLKSWPLHRWTSFLLHPTDLFLMIDYLHLKCQAVLIIKLEAEDIKSSKQSLIVFFFGIVLNTWFGASAENKQIHY